MTIKDNSNQSVLNVLIGFFGVLSLFTMISLPFAINSLIKYSSSDEWTRVPAEVTKWKRTSRASTSASSRIDFDFEYQYSVNDKVYSSSKVSAYAFPFKSGAPPQNQKMVYVYVNPSDHSQAVVVPGVIRTWFGMFFFPLIFISLLIYSKIK